MKVSITNVVVAVVCIWVGVYFGGSPTERVIVTHVDTVPYSAFRDSLKAERLEADGLRAKLAGHARVVPVYIFRTDTLVTPPDTVVQLIRVEGETLLLAPLIQTSDSLWAPELHRFDIGACDSGWSWAAGELVCDRARLGHLSPFVSASALYPLGATASVGVAWTPGYRSGWRLSLETDPVGRIALGVTRSWTLF